MLNAGLVNDGVGNEDAVSHVLLPPGRAPPAGLCPGLGQKLREPPTGRDTQITVTTDCWGLRMGQQESKYGLGSSGGGCILRSPSRLLQ